MFKIFAKYGTNEKVIMFVPADGQFGDVLSALNSELGGNWLYVDRLKPGEAIKFTDSCEYKGFHGKEERYSDAIIKLI